MNDWTVMVYLAGENNLAEEMVYALKSMQLVGSQPGAYEVVALYDGGFGPVTIEVPPTKFSSLDVTNLHEISEEARKKEKDKAMEQLKELEKEVKDLKAESEEAVNAATIPGEPKPVFYSMAGAGTSTSQSSTSTGVQLPHRPIDELLKLANGKKDNQQKKVDKGTTPIDPVALTDSAREFLKEALENNAIKRAEDYELVTTVEEEVTNELTALSNGRQVIRTVRTQLADFVINSINKHKAHHYMLVLSGHGSGAVGDFLPGNANLSSITIAELRDALEEVSMACTKEGKEKFKIDILGFDSCLMGMGEVAFEVRHYANSLIGSEGFEPATGWPYDVILSGLQSPEGRELKGLPERIVQAYITYYGSDYTLADVSTHLCAMDLTKVEPFADAVSVLAHRLRYELERERTAKENAPIEAAEAQEKRRPKVRPLHDAVVLAHWEAQGFKLEQHADLWDFCDCLETRNPSASIVEACQNVKSAIVDEKNPGKSLVLSSKYCGPTFQYARGLSIFFPWANNTDSVGTPEIEHYKYSLEFAGKTGWPDFVKEYHAATQRPTRPGTGPSFPSTLNRREGLFTGKPMKFGLTNAARFGLTNAARFGLTNAARFGLTNAARFGLTNAARFGLTNAARFGLTNAARFGLTNAARFGLTNAARFGLTNAARFGLTNAARFGLTNAARFASGGGLAKIESMKNPPTEWQQQPSDGDK